MNNNISNKNNFINSITSSVVTPKCFTCGLLVKEKELLETTAPFTVVTLIRKYLVST